MPVSVLILTLNEEKNLPNCLESVKWADDILVVDSFSTDCTMEIARSAGARVLQRKFDNFAAQRNFGLDHGKFKYDWVLHLDADEVITRELSDEIRAVIGQNEINAFRIPSKMMFYGKWLKHSGMYPTYQVRLGCKDKLRFVQVGHGQRENLPLDRIGTLKNPLIHHSFSKGLTDWLERHNRYSKDEALRTLESISRDGLDWAGLFSLQDKMRRRRSMKELSYRLPFRPTLRFLYMYFFRRGFMDGNAGYTYCRLLSIYECMTVLKVKEFVRAKPENRDERRETRD